MIEKPLNPPIPTDAQVIDSRLWLYVASTKQPQPETILQNGATTPSTITQQASLKALSGLVLSRNKARNHVATLPEKPRNHNPEKILRKLREVAGQNGAVDTAPKEIELLVARPNLRTAEGPPLIDVSAVADDIAAEFGTTAAFCLAMLCGDDFEAISTGADPGRAAAWRGYVGLAIEQGEAPDALGMRKSPPLICCADCIHANPTGHPALVKCAQGRQALGACGDWWGLVGIGPSHLRRL